MKTFVFDLDGTLCSTVSNGKYEEAQPCNNRIKTVNRLHEEGNSIIICTARGMGRYNNDAIAARSEFYNLTVKQLALWGVRYDEIHLGKPSGDLYIDDKAMRDDQFFKITTGDGFE